MSKESARAFIEKTERDAGLQAQLAALPKEDWEAYRGVASKAGFELTAADLRAALGEVKAARPGTTTYFGTVEIDRPSTRRR